MSTLMSFSSPQSSNCSPLTYLACEVGDLTSKHGAVSLTQRQLFTDEHLQLAGDHTGTRFILHFFFYSNVR